jgi:hypothetical protein
MGLYILFPCIGHWVLLELVFESHFIYHHYITIITSAQSTLLFQSSLASRVHSVHDEMHLSYPNFLFYEM